MDRRKPVSTRVVVGWLDRHTSPLRILSQVTAGDVFACALQGKSNTQNEVRPRPQTRADARGLRFATRR